MNVSKIAACLFLFIGKCLTAQDYSKGVLIIDDKFVTDSIKCYNFNKLQIAFKITNAMLKSDKVCFATYFNDVDTVIGDRFVYSFEGCINGEDFRQYFSGKSIGVITLIDENRKQTSMLWKQYDCLTKTNLFQITGMGKLPPFRVMQFVIQTKEVVGFTETLNSLGNAYVKTPTYGNYKDVFRTKVRFFNPIKRKDKGQKEFLTKGCVLKLGTNANVIMNTDTDLDTYFGYIDGSAKENRSDNGINNSSGSTQNKLQVTSETNNNPTSNGFVEETYANGRIVWKGQYVNKKKAGEWKQYDDGVLTSSINYIGDKEVKTEYFSNGNKKFVGTYINDVENGMIEQYYEDGKLATSCNYLKGKRQGEEKSYNPDGTIASVYSWSNGVLKGPYKSYSGAFLSEEGNYINGKRNGNCKIYDNGKLFWEGQYKDDEKFGTWKEYGSNGKIVNVTTY